MQHVLNSSLWFRIINSLNAWVLRIAFYMQISFAIGPKTRYCFSACTGILRGTQIKKGYCITPGDFYDIK